MKIKTKYIALTLFLVDALLLVINMEYRDPFASVIPDLDYAKGFFYIGTLSFIIYLKLVKSNRALKITAIILIASLSISMLFNLRLAKNNYDRIKCNNEISEYFEYFERDCGLKIEKRFEADVKNGKIKYFQDEFGNDEELLETLKDRKDIEIVGKGCTIYTTMHCYNDLVIDYLKNNN